jgi:hypothetical protein
MPRHVKTALMLVAFGAVWMAAAPARAQVTTSPLVKAKPLHTPGTKTIKARFEVMHMMTTGIQVRSATNTADVHTFTYSDQIHDQMVKMLSHGGYQYGDKVEIEYLPVTQVAVKIEGKPSKPL